jgi:alpha-glucosidase
VWTLGNHDVTRFPTRWTGGDPGLTRCALMLLLTLRGTPVLYYGDELAMPEAEIPPHRVVDPVGLLGDPRRQGRDGARTPMPWRDAPGAGFTAPGVEPWLPFGEVAGVDVESQRADHGSPLWLVHDLIALRRSSADLSEGAYVEVRASGDLWVYTRGEGVLVALNLGDDEASVAASGEIAVCTARSRDGEAVRGTLTLGPREGAVVRVARD